MPQKLTTPAALVIVAAIATGVTLQAHAALEEPTGSPPCLRDAAVKRVPTTPQEMLERLKQALETDKLLQRATYSDEGVKCLLGDYGFQRTAETPSAVSVLFSDDGMVSLADPTFTGLLGGQLSLSLDQFGKRRFRLSAGIRATDARFSSAAIMAVFGSPKDVRPGWPSQPPQVHGATSLPKSDGHLRMSYEVSTATSQAEVWFLMDANHVITEFEITGLER